MKPIPSDWKQVVVNKDLVLRRECTPYRDNSSSDDTFVRPEQSASSASSGGKKGFDHSFPVRLHFILGEIEKDGLSHIVSWQPHGRCFKVHNREQFVEKILPCWFRSSSFTSFQRRLNLYGFRRLTVGRDKGGYYHELFLRSEEYLAHRIQRSTVKGKGGRKPASPETEPNFYTMPFLPPHQNKARRLVNNHRPNEILCLKSMLPMALSSCLDQHTAELPAATHHEHQGRNIGALDLHQWLGISSSRAHHVCQHIWMTLSTPVCNFTAVKKQDHC